MRRIVLASAVAMIIGGSAMTAEAQVVAPVSMATLPVVFTWSGPYVGAFGGYGFGRSSATTVPPAGVFAGFDEGVNGLTLALAPRGLFGGITIGYNRQSGAIVVGVEGEGGFLNFTDTALMTGGLPAGELNGLLDDDTGTVAYGWYATLAARLGIAIDRTLLYAKAGGIIAQYAGLYADLDGAAPGTIDPAGRTTLGGPQYGYLLGGGAEFAFDANWTAKLEYNYFNLGADLTGNTNGDTFVHRNTAHLIKFGLNFIFGP